MQEEERRKKEIEEVRRKALELDINRIVDMLDDFVKSEGARMKLKVTEEISPGEVKKDYYITGAGVPTDINPLKEKKKMDFHVTFVWQHK